MKKSKKEIIIDSNATEVANETEVLVADVTTETAVETTPEVTVEVTLPVEVKKAPGRPVSTTSERQKRLAARAARVASGGSDRPGRPIMKESARQQAIEARNARIAAGDIPKRGRPPFPKPAVTPTPVAPAYPTTDDAVTSEQ